MIRKGKVPLRTLDEWQRLAGPKRPIQWQDYRSAKESARAWLERSDPAKIPEEITHVLGTHADFGAMLEWEAEPECLVPFDEYEGPANIDVLVSGRDDKGGFVIAIEAKADEPYSSPVGSALADALERGLANPSSRGLARIQELVQHLLGPAKKGQPQVDQIRYQLLTAAAAALSHARQLQATRAVVMIHEFRTPRTKPENHDRNARDLIRFLARLGVEDREQVLRGVLVGPIQVPGGGRFQHAVPLYVGKATRTVSIRD